MGRMAFVKRLGGGTLVQWHTGSGVYVGPVGDDPRHDGDHHAPGWDAERYRRNDP